MSVVAAPALPAITTAAGIGESVAARPDARPQWVRAGDKRAALHLIFLMETSNLDGLSPKKFNVKSLKRAVRTAGLGNPAAEAKANAMLDRALLAYVAALREAPTKDWIINDREAVPAPRPAAELLNEAATSPSLDAWISAMPFMHHSYAGLRRALAHAIERRDRRSQELLRANLQRARFLPAHGRYVLVNTAAQRLYMYENGQVVDWMRVVVGKPHQPTPMMAATIKFTALNPYWNVPADLAAERIAPNVIKEGLGYLRQQGYVLLSDWGERARPVNPAKVDWEAVAAGRVLVRVRQNPGPGNAMGRMKFMFPNPQGIYLHDTPNKELLNEDARMFSGGCVRLEDAPRLARWLYGRPLNPKGAKTEQPVRLEKPVPVYLAYLTAVPSGNQVFFFDDIYGKDRSILAAADIRRVAAR
ncbi:MAG TPA: L,D-transpeptidase family protein [Sphingomicrobium sp.]|nr:L,D-transpeptidase family protein [Sphingomicrobium sp.]